MCSMVNYDQFQTTDHIGLCYGYAAVASRRIRLSTVAVDYGRNEIFEHVGNRATKNRDGGSVTVDPGTSW